MKHTNRINIDTSEELHIFKCKNGFRLVRPDNNPSSDNVASYDTGYRIADILQFPFNAAISNLDVVIQCINVQTATTLGFLSTESAKGKQVSHVLKPKSATVLLEHNKKAIDDRQIKMYEEDVMRKDGLPIHRLSLYAPLYAGDENIIGLFGCTVILGTQSLDSSLSHIMRLGFLDSFRRDKNKFLPGSYLCGIYLTKREKEVLNYYIRGMSARNISAATNLSVRTIEGYLANIKIKLNVSSKSELIGKVIDILIS